MSNWERDLEKKEEPKHARVCETARLERLFLRDCFTSGSRPSNETSLSFRPGDTHDDDDVDSEGKRAKKRLNWAARLFGVLPRGVLGFYSKRRRRRMDVERKGKINYTHTHRHTQKSAVVKRHTRGVLAGGQSSPLVFLSLKTTTTTGWKRCRFRRVCVFLSARLLTLLSILEKKRSLFFSKDWPPSFRAACVSFYLPTRHCRNIPLGLQKPIRAANGQVGTNDTFVSKLRNSWLALIRRLSQPLLLSSLIVGKERKRKTAVHFLWRTSKWWYFWRIALMDNRAWGEEKFSSSFFFICIAKLEKESCCLAFTPTDFLSPLWNILTT